MVALLMWGGWSRAEEHSIVTIFGLSLGGFIAAMVVVIVGLLAGGPVGRFKVERNTRWRLVRGGRQAMILLRFFNVQGIAGIAVGLALAVLLVIQKGETRHWKKESGRFEQLYAQEQAALAGTVANYRAAADAARAADRANLARVAAEQRAINERTSNDYEARLAAAPLLLGACAGKPQAPQPIPAVAEQRLCPAYPLPPTELLKPPAKTDFLPTTPSPPPSRPSSSTN